MDSLFRTLQKTNYLALAISSCVWIEANHIPALLAQLSKLVCGGVAIYHRHVFPMGDGDVVRRATTGQKQSAGRKDKCDVFFHSLIV